MIRTQKLREAALSASHKYARMEIDKNWNTKNMALSLPERSRNADAGHADARKRNDEKRPYGGFPVGA